MKNLCRVRMSSLRYALWGIAGIEWNDFGFHRSHGAGTHSDGLSMMRCCFIGLNWGLMCIVLLSNVRDAKGDELQEKIITSHVSAVVVYSDRAVITRHWEQSLGAGRYRLVYQALPASLVPETLHVSTSDQTASIQGINYRTTSLAESRKAERRKLEDEIADLTSKKEESDDRSLTLNESLEDLRFLSTGLSGAIKPIDAFSNENSSENAPEFQPLTESRIAEQFLEPGEQLLPLQLLEGLQARRTALRDELRSVKRRSAELEQQLAQRRERLAAIGELAETEGYEVSVDIDIPDKATVAVDLSYMITGASWRPVYDARYWKDKNQVQLIYNAMVRQKTGEDWIDVQLELSSGRPSFGDRPNGLKPWVLRSVPEAPNPPPVVVNESAANVNGTVAKNADVAPENETGDLFAFGSKSSSASNGTQGLPASGTPRSTGVTAKFMIPNRTTIRSSDTEEKVAITELEFDVAINRLSIPTQEPFAYVRAEATNDSEYVLLGGRANIFFGGDFLAPSKLDTTLPNERFELFLGADPRIEVEQKLISREEGNAGLISQSGEVSLRFQIRLSNRSAEDRLQVVVQDRIPVPADPEITVVNLKSEPHIAETNDLGILSWHIDLQPSSTQIIDYSYSIRFPKGKMPGNLRR